MRQCTCLNSTLGIPRGPVDENNVRGCPCPSWVKLDTFDVRRTLPVTPQNRKSAALRGTSESCQKRPHAVQQKSLIRSPASASSFAGIASPSALAVLRLMTNSNLEA